MFGDLRQAQFDVTPEAEALGVFKANREAPFHRWVHLTEGFSAKLVSQELTRRRDAMRIFDPFGGTGTTPLVAAEMVREAYWSEVNPYLQEAAATKVAAARASGRDREKVASVLPGIVQRDHSANGDAGTESPLAAANESRGFFSPESLITPISLRCIDRTRSTQPRLISTRAAAVNELHARRCSKPRPQRSQPRKARQRGPPAPPPFNAGPDHFTPAQPPSHRDDESRLT